MDYQRRIVDDLLDEVLPELPAIALEGAKGVGKTATATQRARSVLTLSEPAQRAAVAGNHALIRELPQPVLIDEWQLEPGVWDTVRHAVDAGSGGGSFLLAGSAHTPPGVHIHSGAGRIVSLKLRPLAWSERGLGRPTVSLAELLRGATPRIAGLSGVNLRGYAEEITRSGFPGIRRLGARARGLGLDSYVSRLVERELAENGAVVRRPSAMMAWLRAYAAATSTDAAYSAILDAATPGEGDKPSNETARGYRQALERLFVLDPVPAWTASFTPLRRLTKTPKHHLADPALAARLVGIEADGLLVGSGPRAAASKRQAGARTWLGALFESLVTQSVRVYAAAADASVGHLRTKNTEHEIDLIVEARDLSVVAIEVKTSDTVTARDTSHLAWLQAELGDRLVDRVVLYAGEHAYRDPSGTAIVPFALLGP